MTIYHGDTKEILPMLGNLDLVLTDPPWEASDKAIEIFPKRGRVNKSFTLKYGDVGYFDLDVIRLIVAQCQGDCFILSGYKELGKILSVCEPRGV
jgi:hypothetical protein